MDRQATLKSLIEFSAPVEELEAQLGTFPWDWHHDPLVTLTRDHIAAVLERFINGEIDAATVEEWADLIELREGMQGEPGHEEEVRAAIHDLANPILQGSIEENVSGLLASLRASRNVQP